MLNSIAVLIDGIIHYGGLALIHGTVLALLTWLLSVSLLRRSHPALQAILWTIVLLKFLLPPVLPGEMALSGWITEGVSSVSLVQFGDTESSPLPINGNSTDLPAALAAAESPGSKAPRLLFICYLFLVVVLGVRGLVMFKRTSHRVRSLPRADFAMLHEVLELAESIGLKHPPEVRTTPDYTTPYVFGFRRPVLVLPERLMRGLEAAERRALLLHELAHIRRKDLLIRGLQGLAGVLFFFFPPVLWVSRRVDHFTEVACDRWAVAVSGVGSDAYAGALMQVVRGLGRAPQAQGGLSLIRGVKALEQRLLAVLSDENRRSPRLSLGAKAMLTGWSLFVLAGGSTAEVRKPAAILPPMLNNVAQTTHRSAAMKSAANASASPEYLNVNSRQRRGSSNQTASEDQGQRNQDNKAALESRVAAERHGDAETRAQKDTPSPPMRNPLTPYEQGYLLARQYAQERALRSQASPARSGRTQTSSEGESKRDIELRIQELTKRPARQ